MAGDVAAGVVVDKAGTGPVHVGQPVVAVVAVVIVAAALGLRGDIAQRVVVVAARIPEAAGVAASGRGFAEGVVG